MGSNVIVLTIKEFYYISGRDKLFYPIEAVNGLKRVLGVCLDIQPRWTWIIMIFTGLQGPGRRIFFC